MPATLPADEPYLLLPEQLALDLRDTPLAVGIYLLVGRTFLIHQGPIPLSANDIIAYNGHDDLLRGAIVRALIRLRKRGYIIPQSPQARGLKATYLPAWGRVGGEAHPWSFDAAGLDRPRSVRAVRIPRVLIDVCLGRITPHQRHPAIIDRYVTRPPVSLEDLGAYGLSWAGIPTPTPALTRLGLLSPSGPLPPPAWEQLLARISQQPLFDADPDAPRLSLRGLQRAGFTVAPATPAPDSPPLFFVPTDMIGDMISTLSPQVIAQVICESSTDETGLSASESIETQIANAAETTIGTQGISGISGNEATPAPTASAITSAEAESSSSLPLATAKCFSVQPATADATPTPDIISPAAAPVTAAPAATPVPASATPAEELLRELGVYPSVARQHRDLSLALIERAHTIAQRLPGRRSVAATIAQLLHEEQVSPGWLRNGRPDLFLGPMREDDPAADPEEAAPDVDDDDPCARVHALLCATLSQRLSLFIEPQHIALDADEVVVRVPVWFSSPERAAVGAALSAVAAQIGLRVTIPIEEVVAPVPHTPAPIRASAAEPAPRNECPDWISPEQWSQLHLIARGALSGSRWVDGEIVGAGPGTTRLLRGSLAGLVARLNSAAEHGVRLEQHTTPSYA